MKKVLIVILIVLSFTCIAYAGQDVIDDPAAGLQWMKAPDQDTTWDQAENYAKYLTAGGGGWRLPTVAELKSLYNRVSSFGGAAAFGVKDRAVWSSEVDTNNPSLAWYVSFNIGYAYTRNRTYSNSDRALAVRSRR